jgi:hypothetical protein
MFDGQWVSDISSDPVDPQGVYLVTSSGNDGSQNGLYHRDASGAWSQVGALEFVLISRVRVVDLGGGNTRIYQSVLDGTIDGDEMVAGMTVQVPNYLMRYSEDGASSWTSFPLGVIDGTFRLQDVDPSNPDRLVATRDRADEGTTVIVSSDRGETWTDYLELTEFGGLAFAPDGRVWIGDSGATTDPEAPIGIYAAASLDESPTLLTGDYPVRCLRYIDDDTLFACQRFTGGLVKTADGTMEESFKFTEVESLVSCDGVDMLAACEMQLRNAYCGITHFPLAPLCEPYGVDLSALDGSSGCAFNFDAGVGTGTLPDGGCIEPADAGAPMPTTMAPPDDGSAQPMTDTGAAPSGPGGAAGDGTGGGSSGGGDDGGCLVVAPGAERGATGALGGLLAALVGLLAVRRRRRK